MAKSPQEILKGWRQSIPPETPKEDVAKVVEFYFPGMYRYKDKGSHWLSITDPMLIKAQDAGYTTGTLHGTISLSLHQGRTVKKVYVDHLFKAIKLKEEIEEAESK